MGTISRINDIINANIQAALDHAERPEKMVRMMIAEFQDGLAELRARAAQLIAERRRLTRRLGRLETIAGDWGQKAERALAKGREDLARAALHQKVKIAKTIEEARGLRDEAGGAVGEYETQITALRGKLAEAREKFRAMAPRPRPDHGHRARRRRQPAGDPGLAVRVEAALQRLDKIEDRLDDHEGTIEAYDLGGDGDFGNDLAELEVDDAILAELEALKQSAREENPSAATGPRAKSMEREELT